jgi:hypothetical protein
MMIPASAEYDVPSAGDEAIFGEILRSLGRDAGPVTAVLQMLDADGPFADIDPQRRDAIAARLRETVGARYYTAFGPLRLDLATPLHKRSADSPIQVYISLGQAF